MCSTCREKDIKECLHSYTNILHNHKAVNYSLVIVDRYYKVYLEKTYTGADAVENFLTTLVELETSIRDFASKEQEMSFTDQDKVNFEKINHEINYFGTRFFKRFFYLFQEKFQAARNCYICKAGFKSDADKVRDHDHQTSRFIGK